MQAIETRYHGARFRSRLEARWAVFFDALDIPWEYEKEGYRLPSGLYLPDFWLPMQNVHIEVKPDRPNEEEKAKAFDLARESGRFVFMLIGSDWCCVQCVGEECTVIGSHLYFTPGGDWDGCMCWGECPTCGAFRIGHHGFPDASYSAEDDLLPPVECFGHRPKGYVWANETPRLLRAYAAAKSARFEFEDYAP
ncbi:MAG TPA: hypothetical protein VM537_35835 [Anaerolineae bacterium]|nr:hypothetical protein [Anaerolineae bacterium]